MMSGFYFESHSHRASICQRQLYQELSALIDLTADTDLPAKYLDLGLCHIKPHAFAFGMKMEFIVQAEDLVLLCFQVNSQPIVLEP